MRPYFSEDGIVIYNCDCRELLPSLGQSDLLITDPPYGLRAARADGFGSGVKRHMTGLVSGKCIPRRDYGDAEWDDSPADLETLESCMALAKWHVIFGGNYFALPPARCWLIWDKLRGETDYADAEMAWTNLDRSVRLIRWRWNGFLTEGDKRDERVHPTQKPCAVMHWAIRQAPSECARVFDPFAGSGTTLLAAKSLGRTATGIELEEKYCEIAANRLRQKVMQFA
jgi:DNA modification methylase